ncbi:MAG: hypothetical protein FWH45_00250 [Methanomassiliicoccaceae archaeon]|nr:hypothetical protein [Methanomassiliicoccaceae archaeon]MCL2145606.1 hypothetical protein [Methanomassiliicoccaceae archaeon]
MAKKTVAFPAVIVAVFVICAATGYIVWSNDRNSTSSVNEYWFYVDYGGEAPNGWISAKSDNAYRGFIKALDENEIKCDFDEDHDKFIISINGVRPDTAAGKSWYVWEWTKVGGSNAEWRDKNRILEHSTETIFYLGVTGFVFIEHEIKFVVLLDPNVQSGWQNGGPFAS